MRALIMGGTEFISLHLVQSLLRRGHEVTVFNRGRRAERLPAGVRAIVGDRKDHAGLRERLKAERFDGVFDVTYAPTLGPDVCQYDLLFVADVTVPDGTQFAPGETFDKRWKVQNAGVCAWGPDFRIVLVAGDALAAPTELALYPALPGAL